MGYEIWMSLAFVFVDPSIIHDANMLEMKRERKEYKVMVGKILMTSKYFN